MSPGSGKILKSDDSVLDLAALLEAVYDVASRAIKTTGGGGTSSEVDANLQVGGAAVSAANPVPVSVAATLPVAQVAGGFAPMSALASLAGYNEIIAAPGEGDEIIVAGFTIQATEDGAQIATLCSAEDDTVGFVARLATAGDGLKWVFPAGNEWRLGEDTALDLNLSGYTEVQVTVYYKTAGVVPWA
jgi:hypothetical protein